jgi:uncharacterized protein (UPF0333 family)
MSDAWLGDTIDVDKEIVQVNVILWLNMILFYVLSFVTQYFLMESQSSETGDNKSTHATYGSREDVAQQSSVQGDGAR